MVGVARGGSPLKAGPPGLTVRDGTKRWPNDDDVACMYGFGSANIEWVLLKSSAAAGAVDPADHVVAQAWTARSGTGGRLGGGVAG